MSKIQILDQYTINQIAAGEVVERPQAVVKELVENAIDAKASAITVEIKSGGIDFIRVTDNGSGIDKEDIPKAFLRHSTSKIRKASDLQSVSSLGFRGEALSSISAISQVELITKTSDSITGIRFRIAGEDIHEPEEIGCPNGTTIIVRNLFFNTPARKKFLKAPSTEAGYINELMNRLAASHPNISFKFINNNKINLQTSGNANLKDVIYNIYGREIAFNLIPVDAEDDGISLKGFIGEPKISRGNRNYENYFLNGRYIKSSIITKAIEDAYKPYTMNHRFPFTNLHMELKNEEVDVNVHPTKLEVRFKEGSQIYDFVYTSVRQALEGKDYIGQISLVKEDNKPPKQEKMAEPFEENRRQQEYKEKSGNNDEKHSYLNKDNNKRYQNRTSKQIYNKDDSFSYEDNLSSKEKEIIKEKIKDTEIGKLHEIVEEADAQVQFSFLSEDAMKDHRIIGQVFSTYWLIEYDENLYIIDQHAAHEKVMYENLMDDLNNKKILTQNLNPPIVISLGMREKGLVLEYLEDFNKLGFEIEEFGGNEYAIRTIPSDLSGLAGRDIFIELIDNLTEEIYNAKPESLINKIATTSCKAAVKGNQKLSVSEVNALIESLLQLDNPYFCPHGRPTMIALSKYELEKKFKRVL